MIWAPKGLGSVTSPGLSHPQHTACLIGSGQLHSILASAFGGRSMVLVDPSMPSKPVPYTRPHILPSLASSLGWNLGPSLDPSSSGDPEEILDRFHLTDACFLWLTADSSGPADRSHIFSIQNITKTACESYNFTSQASIVYNYFSIISQVLTEQCSKL